MHKIRKEPVGELWVMRHTPRCQSDLVVHKKKVEEVSAWIQRNLHHVACGKAPILLLIGPTGSGKTITVQILANHLNFEIAEWINPVVDSNLEYKRQTFLDDYEIDQQQHQHAVHYESQLSKFRDFLFRVNRYPALTIFGNSSTLSTRKLLLVKDFPNAVLQDPNQFHDVLRNYHKRGNCPLIFIVTDSDGSIVNERLLFPSDIQMDLKIDVIRFNPVAATNMMKVLSRIAALELSQNPDHVRVLTAEALEQLVISSSGDIRIAVNSLQFLCLNSRKCVANKEKTKEEEGSRKRSAPKNKSKLLNSMTSTGDKTTVGVRDTNFSLFRALGKILYCKREEKSDDECVDLPLHLSCHQRDPLSMIPEEVVEKCHMSTDGFCAFLHQNYLDFYTNLDDVVIASEYLSDADHLTREWNSRPVLQQYASSVSTRGILFCNTSRAMHKSVSSAAGLGWKPLHKPQLFEVSRKFRENRESLQRLFRTFRLDFTELVIDVLPFINNISHLNQSQAATVNDMRKFIGFSYRNNFENFDEKDFLFEGEVDEEAKSSSDKKCPLENSVKSEISDISVKLEEADEEMTIEEFD